MKNVFKNFVFFLLGLIFSLPGVHMLNKHWQTRYDDAIMMAMQCKEKCDEFTMSATLELRNEIETCDASLNKCVYMLKILMINSQEDK